MEAAEAEADSERKSWSLPDDITREIFARASYNNPLYICQVASFCKDWHRALFDIDFAQRLRHHHVAPLPIGFLYNSYYQGLPTFFPTVKSPFAPINVPDRHDWSAVDYRHGRGLFIPRRDGDLRSQDLMVWDPISGVQRPVPVPLLACNVFHPGMALFCAVPGCEHRPTCNGGKFRIALLFSAAVVLPDNDDDDDDEEEEESELRCLLYSSETDTWEQEALLHDFSEDFGRRPSVVAGQSVYFLSHNLMIFQLDLATHTLTNIELPEMEGWSHTDEDSLILMITDQGELGMVEATDHNLYTWSRSVDAEGNGIWTMGYTFDDYLIAGSIGLRDHSLLGFAEGTDTLFVATREGTFSFELPKTMVKEAYDLNVERLHIEGGLTLVFPVVSLYVPYNALQQGLQQNDGQQHVNQPNHNEALAIAVIEVPAETAMEEAPAESKKRPIVACDESSKQNKQEEASDRLKEGNETEFDGTMEKKQPESGKEQVPGDGQPAVSGRAAVKNSADSGKRNGAQRWRHSHWCSLSVNEAFKLSDSTLES